MTNMAKLEALAAQSRAKVQSKIPKQAVVRDVDDSGMSQRQAAKALGVSHTIIQRDVATDLPKSGNKVATGPGTSQATKATEEAPVTAPPPVEDYEHDVSCPSRMTIGARRAMVFCARERVWLRVPVCFGCSMGTR